MTHIHHGSPCCENSKRNVVVVDRAHVYRNSRLKLLWKGIIVVIGGVVVGGVVIVVGQHEHPPLLQPSPMKSFRHSKHRRHLNAQSPPAPDAVTSATNASRALHSQRCLALPRHLPCPACILIPPGDEGRVAAANALRLAIRLAVACIRIPPSDDGRTTAADALCEFGAWYQPLLHLVLGERLELGVVVDAVVEHYQDVKLVCMFKTLRLRKLLELFLVSFHSSETLVLFPNGARCNGDHDAAPCLESL